MALLLTACERKPDAKARAIVDANRHIESAGAFVTRLSRLSEVTPPFEAANGLRMFTHEVEQWRRTYTTQRAKLMTQGITREESADLSRRYKGAVEDLKLKVEQTERRLSKRGDGQLFYAELLRMREAMRQL